MSQPVGNFRFLFPDEIAVFDLISVPSHGDTGYIVESDLKYPENLHGLHNDYPLAPEHITVSPDMLSDFVCKLQLKIRNQCKNSFPTSSIKLLFLPLP